MQVAALTFVKKDDDLHYHGVEQEDLNSDKK